MHPISRRFLLLLFTLVTSVTYANTKITTLDNGLKVVVKEDHRAPVAISMVWYDIGSADEPGGLTGISHALEHLMFKGTPKNPLGIFSKTIASIGGQENAFTSTDFTAYFEKIAAHHLPTSLELEADRMQHLLLDETEFQKEMKVIAEERRLRTDDNPQALAFERFLATAHLASPYHHPVIGWMSDIQHLTVKDVLHWYDRYYAPNNATLVVVGDVEPEAVFTLAKKHFGQIKSMPLPERKEQVEPPPLGKKELTIHAPANVPLLLLGYTVPSVKTVAHAEEKTPYVLEVIAAILDAGNSGRLNERIIRGSESASSLGVDYNLYTRYQTQFIIYGAPSHNVTLDELSDKILFELERLKQSEVSPEELQRVKTQLVAQKVFERDSIFGQAMEIGLLETIGLGFDVAGAYEEKINAVTPEDIQATAKRYFNENQMTEAHLIPEAPQNTGDNV